MTAIETQKKAFIRDDALVLYFDMAENPIVARFDLNSLVQANFEVVKRDTLFALILRDFSGQQQDIAQFASKTDAHQSLYAILQALLEKNEKDSSCAKKGCCGKRSLFGSLVKWAFILIGVVAVLYVGLVYLNSVPAPTDAPSDVPAASAEQTPNAAPMGEAVDLDSILPETSPDVAEPAKAE